MFSEEALRILRYWFDVEALAAPNAEQQNESCAEFLVSYVREGAYPWQAGPATNDGPSPGREPHGGRPPPMR